MIKQKRAILDQESHSPNVHSVSLEEATVQSALSSWNRLYPSARSPQSFRWLQKPKGKTKAVMQLDGIGPDGSNVVAKRCTEDVARRERIAYQEILPSLPGPRAAYYGDVADQQVENRWLFVEFAGNSDYDPGEGEHRSKVAEWLSGLHRLEPPASVILWGSKRDLKLSALHLESANSSLNRLLYLPTWDTQSKECLVRCQVIIAQVMRSWNLVQEIVARQKPSIVHGDLVAKNIRMTRLGDQLSVSAFDWEYLGIGIPGNDLGESCLSFDGSYHEPDAASYCSGLDLDSTFLDPGKVSKAAAVGKILWVLPALDLEILNYSSGEWMETVTVRISSYLREIEMSLARIRS